MGEGQYNHDVGEGNVSTKQKGVGGAIHLQSRGRQNIYKAGERATYLHSLEKENMQSQDFNDY